MIACTKEVVWNNAYLPVNMLATPKEILNSSGYLRSFPGIAKRYDVNGVSRGVEYNMAQSAVYRVCGSKLYKGESEVGDVSGSGRVSMAHGRTSQAVGVNGQLVEYRYDGTVKTSQTGLQTADSRSMS